MCFLFFRTADMKELLSKYSFVTLRNLRKDKHIEYLRKKVYNECKTAKNYYAKM